MTDTPETLQSALDDLTRRVAAFNKAQKAEQEEPPALMEYLLLALEHGEGVPNTQRVAARRLRYLESAHAADQAELARLREGLK